MAVLTSSISLLSLYHQPSGSTVILDSGAAVLVVHSSILISPFASCVATDTDGNNLCLSGQGDMGPLSSILISGIIRHNCISISKLCYLGYSFNFTKKVDLSHPSCDMCGSCDGGLILFPLLPLCLCPPFYLF